MHTCAEQKMSKKLARVPRKQVVVCKLVSMYGVKKSRQGGQN